MHAEQETGQRRSKKSAGLEGPATLAVDIGGTGIKASVLDPAGALIAARVEVDTPDHADPERVLDAVTGLARSLPRYDRVSVGFPGVVRFGRVMTAPNLGTELWRGFDLATAVSERLHAPARVINDAVVQGLGVVQGRGLECILTLGTGVGCALYRNGRLILPMELGQHRARGSKTYDRWLGNAALHAKGRKRWNRRLRKTIAMLESLVGYDTLYVGGGNARKVETDALPDNVRIVSNMAGITGGVRLWDAGMEEHFVPPEAA